MQVRKAEAVREAEAVLKARELVVVEEPLVQMITMEHQPLIRVVAAAVVAPVRQIHLMLVEQREQMLVMVVHQELAVVRLALVLPTAVAAAVVVGLQQLVTVQPRMPTAVLVAQVLLLLDILRKV